MIIRNDFVTNSSSTNFVLLGEPIEVDNITQDIFENKEFDIWAIGRDLSEGVDLFSITSNMIPHLNQAKEYLTFYKTYYVAWDCDDINLKKFESLGDKIYKCKIESGYADQHSTSSLSDFIDRYIIYDEDDY